MKTIEKLGIDAMLSAFVNKNAEQINALKSAKAAAEMAQVNFKKIAGPIMSVAKAEGQILIDDEVSTDVLEYYEHAITEILTIPFKTKTQ
jgi:hypothetical protein